MSVTGYVGLPGSGKTLHLVDVLLDAIKNEKDLYTNFLIGHREPGYLLPACSLFSDRDVLCWSFPHRSFDPHVAHVPGPRVFFAADSSMSSEQLELCRRAGFRRGRGFVRDPKVTVLDSWDQLTAIRVHRDALGRPHKLRLVQLEDGTWDTERVCLEYNCQGCSKGIVVGIDELNLWAPSRMWQELGLGVLNRWAYNRKDGLAIYWTAQHEARIDKVAREVTDFIWNCRCLGGVVRVAGHELHLQVFHRRRYIPALLTDTNRTEAKEGAQATGAFAGDFEFSFFHGKLAESYDTYEHVQANKELAVKLAAKAAKAATASTTGIVLPFPASDDAPPATGGGTARAQGQASTPEAAAGPLRRVAPSPAGGASRSSSSRHVASSS